MSGDHSQPGVVGECCVSGYLETGEPKGTEITLAGLPTYLARARTEPSKLAILFLTDIFGFRFINARLVADHYAEHGFDVYIPDLHDGQSIDVAQMKPLPPQNVDGDSKSAPVTTLMEWRAKHGIAQTLPKLEAVIAELRSSKHGIEKLASMGFCWGGGYSAMVASRDVDVAMIAHPSPISNEVLGQIKVPTIWNLAEGDQAFPKESEEAVQRILTEKSIRFEMTIYKDVRHGFLIRGDPTSKDYIEAKKDAHAKTVAFFKSVL
ncbi:dienelactone hydrolase [Cladochytrium replicatum]|nr:dienelactone hydrolase [Cladochytrium replicatum]